MFSMIQTSGIHLIKMENLSKFDILKITIKIIIKIMWSFTEITCKGNGTCQFGTLAILNPTKPSIYKPSY